MANWLDGTTGNRTAADAIKFDKPPGSGTSLPTLPDASYPAGALFCMTTDFTLYRSTGTVWNQITASVAAGAITNTEVNAAAAIAYSKLNLGTSIVNGDVSTSAAIAESKLALLDNEQQPYGVGTPLAMTAALGITTNSGRGMRWVVQKTGSITDMMVYTSVISGNFQLGIFDVAATTRHLLKATAIVAAAQAASYQAVPLSSSLAVTKGDSVDLAIWADNSTLTFGRGSTILSNNQTLLPTGWLPGAGIPRYSWQVAFGAGGLADFAESSFTLQPHFFIWVKYA